MRKLSMYRSTSQILLTSPQKGWRGFILAFQWLRDTKSTTTQLGKQDRRISFDTQVLVECDVLALHR